MGLLTGIGGALGMVVTGLVADRLARRDPRWYAWIGALTIALYFPFMVGFLLIEQAIPAILLYFIPLALGAVYLGPAIAMTHALVTVRMRALASSVLLFVLNLIGMGLGPQLVGILNDALAPRYGVESIRYSLLWVGMAKLLALVLFLLAALFVVRDLKAKDRLGERAG
jgi:MFS family permease